MKILKWVYCWKDSRLQQNCKGLKILTPKQMIQRLPIILAQVKTGNIFQNLPNEIRQIIYSWYRGK